MISIVLAHNVCCYHHVNEYQTIDADDPLPISRKTNYLMWSSLKGHLYHRNCGAGSGERRSENSFSNNNNSERLVCSWVWESLYMLRHRCFSGQHILHWVTDGWWKQRRLWVQVGSTTSRVGPSTGGSISEGISHLQWDVNEQPKGDCLKHRCCHEGNPSKGALDIVSYPQYSGNHITNIISTFHPKFFDIFDLCWTIENDPNFSWEDAFK